ncbi:MAG: hypothetical protein IID30_14815, partial [Planctomycetes bacterium]|nr:hypothetical protein [Planctomycetota bacterium]
DHGADIGGSAAVLLARDNGTSWDIKVVAEDDPFAVGMSVASLRFDIDGNEVILFSIEHCCPFSSSDELFLTGHVPLP